MTASPFFMREVFLKILLLGMLVAIFAGATPAQAQYIFLDTSGDAACTYLDGVLSSTTLVDVYLDTNHTASGEEVSCPSGEPLSINSYSFLLVSELACGASAMEFVSWADSMGFGTNLGEGSSGLELWVTRVGGFTLPPGTYKLGTLTMTTDRYSLLRFAEASSSNPNLATWFGSECSGASSDNTIRLGTDFWDSCTSGTICSEASRTRTTWGKMKDRYRK